MSPPQGITPQRTPFGTVYTSGNIWLRPPRVRIYCTQFATCRWAGYRLDDDSKVWKSCPRCGKPVTK